MRETHEEYKYALSYFYCYLFLRPPTGTIKGGGGGCCCWWCRWLKGENIRSSSIQPKRVSSFVEKKDKGNKYTERMN
jgi:hypothetical protein